jgi:serine protease inhibitor
MNTRLALITLLISFALFLSSCGGPEIQPADDSAATSEGVSALTDANNQFAIELYSTLKDSNDNIFFSPYSVSSAFALVYEGARGKTADEISAVLHFPADYSELRPNFARIYNLINKEDKEYKLYTANALWAQEGYNFLPEYFSAISQYYGGKVTNLDFIGKPAESVTIVNDWVEAMTNDKIKDLVPANAVNPLTRLILTNAIYFKGDWILKFDKKKTREADFKVSPEKTVQVQMMGLTGEKAKFNYAETEELHIIELPYKGEELSMLILLPKGDIKELEESLTIENLNQWQSRMHEQQIEVYMPKFKFETKYFMSDNLMRLGMVTPFTWPGADFSGMDGTNDLYISAVIHQAFVEVDEEGTEAAAATAIIMTMGAMRSTTFTADHPFIFMIQERSTGNILFMGKVTDPSTM